MEGEEVGRRVEQEQEAAYTSSLRTEVGELSRSRRVKEEPQAS